MAKIVQLKDNLSKENLYPITLASEVIKGGTSIVPSLLPEGGTVGDVLSNNGETNSWENISNMFQGIEELLYYGVEIDSTISDPHLTRVGNMDLHRSLPIQSKMKGCLLSDDGKVVEYLPEDDWTSSVRDGSKGQVMVEVPDHYRKFVTEGTKYRALISEYPLKGFHKVNKFYISAYEASLLRSTKKLSSVVNTSEDYRGGNNNAEWDGTYRSLIGMPATSITPTNFRTYARNRNGGDTQWNMLPYTQYIWLYWLFVIEYATLNSQAPYNAELTAEGFRQGGLGQGVTTLIGDKWNGYNGYFPFIPCGYTDEFGNGTGVKDFTMPDEYDPDATSPKVVNVPRYRGIENPFGHIFKWCDGVNIKTSATEENGGDGLVHAYICDDPDKFAYGIFGDPYRYLGPLPANNGYIKQIYGGVYGDILPLEVGASSTTFFCDHFYRRNSAEGDFINALAFGGRANYGGTTGLSCTTADYSTSGALSYFGSRLCFIPKLN